MNFVPLCVSLEGSQCRQTSSSGSEQSERNIVSGT